MLYTRRKPYYWSHWSGRELSCRISLKKGYEVHGVKRRSSSFNTDRIDHLYQDPHITSANFILHYGDLTDSTNLIRIMKLVNPDEIYNLGAQSHVAVSFETPEYTANSDAIGTLRILEAIRILEMENRTKFYQASTSELYGLVKESPQTEETPFNPRSPYAPQNFMPIGSLKIIEMLTVFLVVMEYCLIMKVHEEENICYEKNNKRFIKNRKGMKNVFILEILIL